MCAPPSSRDGATSSHVICACRNRREKPVDGGDIEPDDAVREENANTERERQSRQRVEGAEDSSDRNLGPPAHSDIFSQGEGI